MAGIPGTGSAVAVANDASTIFDIALRAWGMYDQIRARLRKRREEGQTLTPEEQAIADMTDEQAFDRLRAAGARVEDHADAVIDRQTKALEQEQASEEQPGRETD